MTPTEAANKAARANLARLKYSSSPKDFWEREVVTEIEKDVKGGREYACIINLDPSLCQDLVNYGNSLGWVCESFEETTLFVYWGKAAKEKLRRKKIIMVVLVLYALLSCLAMWFLTR